MNNEQWALKESDADLFMIQSPRTTIYAHLFTLIERKKKLKQKKSWMLSLFMITIKQWDFTKPFFSFFFLNCRNVNWRWFVMIHDFIWVGLHIHIYAVNMYNSNKMSGHYLDETRFKVDKMLYVHMKTKATTTKTKMREMLWFIFRINIHEWNDFHELKKLGKYFEEFQFEWNVKNSAFLSIGICVNCWQQKWE